MSGRDDSGLTPAENTALEVKAIEDRWPMSADVRRKILKRLCAIVDLESEEGARAKRSQAIAAARALLAADRINLDRDRLEAARDRSGTPSVRDAYTIDDCERLAHGHFDPGTSTTDQDGPTAQHSG